MVTFIETYKPFTLGIDPLPKTPTNEKPEIHLPE
jgi:hypothetical protein